MNDIDIGSRGIQRGRTVIVIGLGVVAMSDSGFLARRPVVDYLKRWSESGNVCWFTTAESSKWALTKLPTEVQVFLLTKNPMFNALQFWRCIRRAKKCAVIAAYPAALLLVPSLLLLRSQFLLALYIGNDFERRPPGREAIGTSMKRVVRTMLARALCKRSGVVFARGVTLTNRLRAITSSPVVETKPLTFATHARLRGDSARRVRFLYVGKLSVEKGVDRLLDAYCKAYSDDRNIGKLRLIGDGPLREFVLECQARIPSISWSGYIDCSDDLALAYLEAETLLVPTAASWEGMPRVIDEALSLGLEVWSSPLPSIVQQHGSRVCYFDSFPPSVEEIIRVLRTLPGRTRGSVDRLLGAPAAADQHREYLEKVCGWSQ